MDDREIREALERTQAQLKAALGQVDELERRKQLAEFNEQRRRAEVTTLEARVASLEASLAQATSEPMAEQLAATQREFAVLEQRLAALDQQLPLLPATDLCGKCGGRLLTVWVFAGVQDYSIHVVAERSPSALAVADAERAERR
jgi:DNA repair exonuclease SbcCD ATPase subunit